MPSEYKSARASGVSPRICSGEIYHGLPNKTRSATKFSVCSIGIANPNSASFISSLSVIKIFAGFISMCKIPQSWPACNPLQTSFAIYKASFGITLPFLANT